MCPRALLQCLSNPETMEPMDDLSLEAVEFCQQLGSQASKVSDITGGRDKSVYRCIQAAIDTVNSRATSNAQRIQKWTILPRDFSISGGELGKASHKSPGVLVHVKNNGKIYFIFFHPKRTVHFFAIFFF